MFVLGSFWFRIYKNGISIKEVLRCIAYDSFCSVFFLHFYSSLKLLNARDSKSQPGMPLFHLQTFWKMLTMNNSIHGPYYVPYAFSTIIIKHKHSSIVREHGINIAFYPLKYFIFSEQPNVHCYCLNRLQIHGTAQVLWLLFFIHTIIIKTKKIRRRTLLIVYVHRNIEFF